MGQERKPTERPEPSAVERLPAPTAQPSVTTPLSDRGRVRETDRCPSAVRPPRTSHRPLFQQEPPPVPPTRPSRVPTWTFRPRPRTSPTRVPSSIAPQLFHSTSKSTATLEGRRFSFGVTLTVLCSVEGGCVLCEVRETGWIFTSRLGVSTTVDDPLRP